MAVSCGFYNSINHDRVYDAVQFGEMFDGLINDGVYATIGYGMTVSVVSGMTVRVRSGRAWFNKTWTVNTADYPLAIPAADVLLPRIDAVILEIDTRTQTRNNTFKVISGATASNPSKPTLTRANGLYQYPLAWVTVPANARSLSNNNIEIQVGRSPTPFVTGCAATLDISEWWNQWSGQFNTKLSGWDSTFNTRINNWNTTVNNKINGWTGEFNTDQADRKKRFEDWFEEVKDIISGSGGGSGNVDVAALTSRVAKNEQDISSLQTAVKNIPELATQSEAEAGNNNSKYMSPLGVQNWYKSHQWNFPSNGTDSKNQPNSQGNKIVTAGSLGSWLFYDYVNGGMQANANDIKNGNTTGIYISPYYLKEAFPILYEDSLINNQLTINQEQTDFKIISNGSHYYKHYNLVIINISFTMEISANSGRITFNEGLPSNYNALPFGTIVSILLLDLSSGSTQSLVISGTFDLGYTDFSRLTVNGIPSNLYNTRHQFAGQVVYLTR